MRRHDLAYLYPTANYRLLSPMQYPAADEALQRWLQAQRPLVVARQSATDAAQILLGLTLPPESEPKRISISVCRDAVRKITPPLTLAYCIDTCSSAVGAPLAVLLRQCEQYDIAVSVYGSLAWEILSGTTYRHNRSDIDLVCDIACAPQLVPCLTALQQAQHALPCSLDGEIRFANRTAVNWKELSQALLQPALRVVAKENTCVALLHVTDLLSRLKGHEHVC
ncbi:malonate decarboxylase holo-[acyl-carrier-protein] synthase [Advenella sp. S44]|uniref:malonate decarboxylase holo-[acyl-carrier-protein] synthase n=1 Tax=Advenella sp. S44 TaxID=1982755 RepID=UPI000C2B1CBE|nr:malonate decarboxylase holo-[acyl-carrier-protein] synthase [Advenella sp. S44]PJX25588.1 malonate decarboxylase holo-[acyl-carrier-protein] synthase [Advenella sp. S44]